MTIQQILNAYPIVKKLIDFKLPIQKAYKIYFLAKQINDKRDFFINEEKKLIELYNAEVDQTGQVSFKTEEEKTNFLQDYSKLLNYNIDDINTINLEINELKDIELSPKELILLEGLINFID